MTTLIKDISKTQRKINDSLIEQAVGAKKIGVNIDTKKASNLGISENGILPIMPKPGRAKWSRSNES